MAPRITRKSVLITGCTEGGIGGALAEAFHEKGYHVFATARSISKISRGLSSSPHATCLTLDVLSADSIQTAVHQVRSETGGKLDVLVNNSGGAYTSPGLDVDIGKAKKLFDLNFWAPLAMLQAFAPLLVEAKGCVVNNSSVSAYTPVPFSSMYNASKAALVAASETWRLELKSLGVRTITLITCATKSNFFAEREKIELAESSYYFEVQHLMRDLTDGRMQAKAMPAKQYATKVVNDVESGAAGQIWVGKDATMNKYSLLFSPQSMIDSILEKMVPVSREMAKLEKSNK